MNTHTHTHRWVEGITSENGVMRERRERERKRERGEIRSKKRRGEIIGGAAEKLVHFLTWWLFGLGLLTGLWFRAVTT